MSRKRPKIQPIAGQPKTRLSQTPASRDEFHPHLPLDPQEREALEDMLERLGIEDWDWLLIGDGSGSNWNYQCGWAAVSIDRLTLHRDVWAGVMSRGTVNFAEMMAYLQPLNWYAAEEDRRRKKGKTTRIRQVHIITDSMYCQEQGRSRNLMPHRNGSLWQVFESFQRQGIMLNWHWNERDDVELNRYVDALSKAARILMKENDVQKMVELDASGRVRFTVYDFNPTIPDADAENENP